MLLAACVTLVVTGVLTPALARWARRRDLLDVPNHRSSHSVATPRLGGVAIIAGVLAGIAVSSMSGTSWTMTIVVASAAAIGALGLLDDVRHLPAVLRLIVHALVAAAVVMFTGAETWPALQLPSAVAAGLVVLWLVALTNAFNFMDGIDGIAGLQALIAGAGWAVIGLLTGSMDAAVLGLLLAAASLGFLFFNWHPASVFMGDAGSGFFGFMFAALPLLAARNALSIWAAGMLVVWPFLVDTGFTLLRRASRGENLLAAHRSHVYQRLVLSGSRHDRVTLVYGALALLGAIGAVALVKGQAAVTLAVCATIASASVLVWRIVVSREAGPGAVSGKVPARTVE